MRSRRASALRTAASSSTMAIQVVGLGIQPFFRDGWPLSSWPEVQWGYNLLPRRIRLELRGEADQVGHGAHAQLAHHAAAMDLDGLFHCPELMRDLLVQPAGNHVREYLALARRERRQPLAQHGELAMMAARRRIPVCRARHRSEQLPVVERLGQEVDGACLHGAHARRNVADAGDEDDRPVDAAARQRRLQLEAIEAGHGDVEHRTPGHRRIVPGEEVLRRRKGLHRVAGDAQQPRQRLQHARVVVDQEHRGRGLRHFAATMATCTGRMTVAVAPPSALFSRLSRPSCALTMVEQIDRPRPSPCALVVKNGWNSRRDASAERPRPQSAIVISMSPSGLARVRTVTRRRGGTAAPIASMAFISRFSSTCCNCTASPNAGGRRSASTASTWIFRPISSLCSSRSVERTRSLTSTGADLLSPFFSSPRSRRITSPARVLSCMMSSRTSVTVSRSGFFSPTMIRAACAFAWIAVSGWLSSCAIAPDSSPSTETRIRCVTSWRCSAASASAAFWSVTSTKMPLRLFAAP